MAVTAGFVPGVHNEYLYEEIVFITGQPLKFTGTLEISERDRGDSRTTTYKYKNMVCNDLEESNKLTRNITFITEFDQRSDKGQAIASTQVSKATETLKIGRDNYRLSHFQLSQSDIVDIRPAADFYSGNLRGRKVYDINRGDGEVVIEISGEDVGYENFWGHTDTQVLNYTISSKRFVEDEEGRQEVSWDGTVRIQASDSAVKSLRYSQHDANLSSFEGGYMRNTQREKVARYDYDLPRMLDLLPDGSRRNRDQVDLLAKYVPNLERLVVPKFRDVRGHWAQTSIEKLYSLDVFDESPNFFSPEIPMTRAEFTKGVIRACDIRVPVEVGRRSSRKKAEPVKSPFKDVDSDEEIFTYIKDGLEKGIIEGVNKDEFKPGAPLTRAQAITILMRALGFASRAPNPGYYTSFADDRHIPNWARDSIYMAREIGILQGDTANRVNPNKSLTRAEASALLIRFLEFLQGDLQRDYRENIFFYQ